MRKIRQPRDLGTPRNVTASRARGVETWGIRNLRQIRSRRVGQYRKLVKPLAGPTECGFSNFMAGVTTLRKGQVSGPATHPGEEIYLILEGIGLAQLGGQRRRIAAESVIAIAPQVLHRLEAVSDVLRYVWVLAPPQETNLKKLVEPTVARRPSGAGRVPRKRSSNPSRSRS